MLFIPFQQSMRNEGSGPSGCEADIQEDRAETVGVGAFDCTAEGSFFRFRWRDKVILGCIFIARAARLMVEGRC